MKKCCFAGHGDIHDETIKEKIYIEAERLYIEDGVKTFWVGNYGDFDRYSASAIEKLKKKYTDIMLELVIPYLTKTIICNKEHYSCFNNIIIANIPQNTLPRVKIIKTNEYMVNSSEYLISYIDHTWGGAYKTFTYANRKKHIKVINIGNLKK